MIRRETERARGLGRRVVAAILSIVFAAVVAVAASAGARAQGAGVDWSGEWDTLWPGGGARITFTQNGPSVIGAYPVLGGTISATSEERRLFGGWSHDGKAGTFLFVLSPDGRTFAGRFGTGAWWTGVRASPDFDPALRVSRLTPAETLQSFLRIAGRAEAGSLEWLGRAAALVITDPAAEGRSGVLGDVQLLDRVLEHMTFRFIDLPRGSDGVDEVSMRVDQAGTGLSMMLVFRRIDGDWLIVAPPATILSGLLERLEKARPRNGSGSHPADDLSNPRAAMQSFIRAMRIPDGSASTAAIATLNAGEIPEIARGRELPLLASFLFQVIDRVGFVYWVEIPDDPNDRTPYVHYRHPEGDIVIAPFQVDGRTIWQFTPETLRTIRRVHGAIEDLPLAPELEDKTVSDPYFIARAAVRSAAPALLAPLGSLERWQWAGIALFLLVGVGISLPLSQVAATRLARPRPMYDAEPEDRVDDRFIHAVVRVAVTAVVLGLFLLALMVALGLPPVEAGIAATIGSVLVVAGLVPVSWQTITLVAERYKHIRRITAHQETFVLMVSSLARIAMLGVAAIALANIFEIPYQGVLAGLGIGGLAVALAVQPVLQNFIAGVVLYADHPLKVGDFCRFGDRLGTVESVGMRSTRIRSLDRTLITVPNAEFANMQLENYSRRDRMHFQTILQLRYETSPDQLRFVLAELRRLMIGHPMILSDPLRVRFVGLGPSSLDLEIFAYVETRNYDEFLAVREDVLLRIMATVYDAGCQFALPATIEYRADDETPDDADRAKAEAAVRSWREAGTLPFPDFDWRDKVELRNRLDYPPAGSGPSTGRDRPD